MESEHENPVSDIALHSSSTPKDNKLRQGFITLSETLLESIADVFPECDDTAGVLRIFRAIVKNNDAMEDKFIWRCHDLFKEYAEGIRTHDAETLFTIVERLDHIRNINLRDKWEDPDFTEESKTHLWQYITSLKTYGDLYAAVPKNVMSKIETVAGSLGDQLVRGELDLSSMDIGSIGRNLLSDLSPEELANFEGKLPEIYESLSHVAGSLGAGQGANLDISALMKQLAEQGECGGDGQSGRVDVTKILQQLTAQMPPGTMQANGNRQGDAIDVANIMSTLGPLVSTMSATASPSPRAALKDAKLRRRN